MPFKAKPFTDPGYHPERLRTMSWLDKMASYMLALNWSEGQGGAAGKPKGKHDVGGGTMVANRQFDSHLDCVAVTVDEDSMSFAANTLALTANNVLVVAGSMNRPLPEELGKITWAQDGANTNAVVDLGEGTGGWSKLKYEIVADGGEHMHAEMRLVLRAKSEGRLGSVGAIGVSKPCCPRCKEVLDRLGWAYTSYHEVPVPAHRWESPGV